MASNNIAHSPYDLTLGLLETGAGDQFFQNNERYRAYKGGWQTKHTSKTGNMEYTFKREGNNLQITRTQKNVQAIMEYCKKYRAKAEAGLMVDPFALADTTDTTKLSYQWVELPTVIAREISYKYFGGLPWEVVSQDPYMKAQFYLVIQKEYPAFICYPGGKLPIPIDVKYPTPGEKIIV